MAEQVLIQFRADKALKQEVAEIYERLGMDLPTAFRMFMVKSKIEKGLPFQATLPENTITRAEIVNQTNLSDRTISRAIRHLQDEKLIFREGSKKTGIWKILE